MTFWVEKSDLKNSNGEVFYAFHYGHSETSVTLFVTKQSLTELKTLLEAEGF
jgi:hypothetical protein